MSTPCLLFVDDEEGLLELYRSAFGREGYVIETVPTIEAARERLARGGIDLLVLDIRLGETSGLALLREVNRQLGTSFLIVTHDPRLAHRCDRIIELVDGRIVADRPNEVAAGRSPVQGSAEETE